jgi:hypothetical protein
MKSSLLRMSFVPHPSIHVLSEIGRMDDWMKGTHAGKPTSEFYGFPDCTQQWDDPHERAASLWWRTRSGSSYS